MTVDDPMTQGLKNIRQQIADEIIEKYDCAIWQFRKLAIIEKYCLTDKIDYMDVETAFASAGLAAKRADGDLAKMSKEEGKQLLKRRIDKHKKLLVWLKDRAEKEIDRAMAKII